MLLEKWQDEISHLNQKQMEGLSPFEICQYARENYSNEQIESLINEYKSHNTRRMGDAVLVAIGNMAYGDW